MSSGSFPPFSRAMAAAICQPPIVPGTVSVACSPAKPQASMARTRPDGSRITQKLSPPMPFMCG